VRRRKKQRIQSHFPKLSVGSDIEFSEYETKEKDDANMEDVVIGTHIVMRLGVNRVSFISLNLKTL
jgi:hypothetical protein